MPIDRVKTVVMTQGQPAQSSWQCDPQAAYVHYVSNETINGLEFPDIPMMDAAIP
jgi:phosphoserine aminotransferase